MVAGDLLGDYEKLLDETAEYNQGRTPIKQEDGKDPDPVKVEMESASLATSGSIEEFNLIRDQRNQELSALNKIAKNTEKALKNQPQGANF